MTQADWVKELEGMECTGYTCNHETSETHYLVSKDFISKVESLAQQRTEKKWRERIALVTPFGYMRCTWCKQAPEDCTCKQNLEDLFNDLLK